MKEAANLQGDVAAIWGWILLCSMSGGNLTNSRAAGFRGGAGFLSSTLIDLAGAWSVFRLLRG